MFSQLSDQMSWDIRLEWVLAFMLGMQGYILKLVTLPEKGLYAEQMPAKIWDMEKGRLKLHLPLHCLIYLF